MNGQRMNGGMKKNERMNERMNDKMNEGRNERIKEGMKEEMNVNLLERAENVVIALGKEQNKTHTQSKN